MIGREFVVLCLWGQDAALRECCVWMHLDAHNRVTKIAEKSSSERGGVHNRAGSYEWGGLIMGLLDTAGPINRNLASEASGIQKPRRGDGR